MTDPKRLALVIGNGYQGEQRVSGREDAERMASYLEQLDFTVSGPHFDLRLDEMESRLDAFGEQIVGAREVVFFFSGHGYQIGGENYLLPRGKEVDLAAQTIDPDNPQMPLSRVLETLEHAPNDTPKIVFLDACRSTADLAAETEDQRLASAVGWGGGLARPGDLPPTTVLSFSAEFGEEAESGTAPGELSPYTAALTESIREPGLELGALLARVTRDLRWVQTPVDVGQARLAGQRFFFRPPVSVPLTVQKANDSVLVLLNGRLLLTASEQQRDRAGDLERIDLPLEPGPNELLLLVSNGSNYRDNQNWQLTEDWHYAVTIHWPPGTTLADGTSVGELTTVQASEPVPFKGGPHHGRVFEAAKVLIEVDPGKATLSIEVEDDLWDTQAPVWARSQKELWAKALDSLPLDRNPTIANYLAMLGLIKDLLEAFGLGDDIKLPDPGQIYALVWGNAAFEDWVETSMDGEIDDRLRDLEISLRQTLAGDGWAFRQFDRALNESLRTIATNAGEHPFAAEDIRVWTALEQRREADGGSVALPTESPLGASAWPGELDGELLSQLTAIEAQSVSPSSSDPMQARQDREVFLGRHSVRESVEGVDIDLHASVFLSVGRNDRGASLDGRIVLDLSDLQRQIGRLVDQLDLPKDNCAKPGGGNLVVELSRQELRATQDVASLGLWGKVEVWACLGPFKTRTLRQSFSALMPFRLIVGDNSQHVAVRFERPSIDLRGDLGNVVEGVLSLAGIDLSTEAHRWLERSVARDWLKLSLPPSIQRLRPSMTHASLFDHEGSLMAELRAGVPLDLTALRRGGIERQRPSD